MPYSEYILELGNDLFKVSIISIFENCRFEDLRPPVSMMIKFGAFSEYCFAKSYNAKLTPKRLAVEIEPHVSIQQRVFENHLYKNSYRHFVYFSS